jgi:cell division FtsZ-interacting protein ZapD
MNYKFVSPSRNLYKWFVSPEIRNISETFQAPQDLFPTSSDVCLVVQIQRKRIFKHQYAASIKYQSSCSKQNIFLSPISVEYTIYRLLVSNVQRVFMLDEKCSIKSRHSL